MTKIWLTILVALLFAFSNCYGEVVIQSDLNGEEIRGPGEIISISNAYSSAFSAPGAQVIWTEDWRDF